jgi:P-type E1-E2 ATPase
MVTAVNGEVAGVIAVADAIKDGSVEAITELHALGLEVVMLTGDNQKTAEAIGAEAGIDRVIAEVLPGDKAAVVKQLQSEGRVVAMVGRRRQRCAGAGPSRRGYRHWHRY